MEEHLYSSIQERWITMIRIPVCLLSIISDIIIVRIIVHHDKFKGPYQRILFAMSICDVLFNIGWIIQPFAVHGNHDICNVAGIITQIGLATFFYAGMLALYFVLTIRFGMRDDKIAKSYEPWFHLICIGYSCVTATVGQFIPGYRPDSSSMTCYMHNAEDTDFNFILIWMFVGGPQLVLLVLIVMSYVIIYRHVRSTINRGRSRSHFLDSDDSQTRRVRAVAVQAMLYVAACLATTLPIPILMALWEFGFMNSTSINVVFSITFILLCILVPMTGFFNLCVYIRPQYIKYRRDIPTKGRLWAIQRCCRLAGGDEPVAASAQQARNKQPPTKADGAKSHGGNVTSPDHVTDSDGDGDGAEANVAGSAAGMESNNEVAAIDDIKELTENADI